jgi:transcriptional regulator
MYNMPYYIEKDLAVLKSFMQEHPFVILCGADSNGFPVATQVPVLIKQRDEKLFLHGHIMRQTDHHKAFVSNPKVLALFTGPHTYVSASWYTNKQQGSTWNYMTVQAKGKLRFLDEAALLDLLRELTAHFENNPSSPSLFEHLPDDYVNRMSKVIVAFEMEITELNNVFKLSQNRDEGSYYNIISQLEKGNGDSQRIAQEMKTRTFRLFDEGSTKERP